MSDDEKIFPVLKTPPGQVSWAHLAEPDNGSHQYADGRYKVTISWPKSTDLRAVRAVIKEAAELEWGVGAAFIDPIHDGDNLFDDKGHKKDDYAGQWKMTFRSKFQPLQYDEHGRPIADLAADGIKTGDTAMVGAQSNPFFDNKTKQRCVSFYLTELQRVSRGTRQMGPRESVFAGQPAPGASQVTDSTDSGEPPF